MLTEVNGLPTHPLLVHAAVVLVPMTLVATILIVVRAQWRRSLGWWVVLLSGAGVVAVVLAKESGEQLAAVVGLPISHAALGDGLPYFAAAQFITVAVYVAAAAVVDRSRARSASSMRTGATPAESVIPGADLAGPAGTSTATTTRTSPPASRRVKMPLAVRVLAGLAIVVGLAATIQTIRVGDTGAQAVWGGELAAATAESDEATPSATASASPSASPTRSPSPATSSPSPTRSAASPSPSAEPSSATASAQASGALASAVFTAAQLAEHDRRSDCYTAINGKVYDLTGWIAANPQDNASVIALCGIDGTAVYLDQTDSPLSRAELAQLQIGVIGTR